MSDPVWRASNRDDDTVDSFGDEWSRFDQSAVDSAELQRLFSGYFAIFPWNTLPHEAEGFDMGCCGSGRWAKLVAPRVGRLNCIDASGDALAVARRALADQRNVAFIHATPETAGITPESQDFGYSLGVLHHVPDTEAALRACVKLLKPGAPFLLYLYYRFDNRPRWFRALWRGSEVIRLVVSRLPSPAKAALTDAIAPGGVPAACSSGVVGRAGRPQYQQLAATLLPEYQLLHDAYGQS